MKDCIRRSIRQKLLAFNDNEIALKSLFIQQNLFTLPCIINSKNIAIYYSKHYEPQTQAIISKLICQNKNVFLPRVTASDIEFRQIKTQSELTEGSFGILEPNLQCPIISPHKLDLIIVPCVAIDKYGNRIGHGKGFFDKFLGQYPTLKTVCLAYDMQFVPVIIPEKHDRPINITVTENKIIFSEPINQINKILKGSELAKQMFSIQKAKIVKENIKAKLAVILVGNDPASVTYTSIKEKRCRDVGIDFELIKFEENVEENLIITTIKKFNETASITGILIQLPIPKHFNTEKILNIIAAQKDVDGLTALNRQKLEHGDESLACCTPKGVIALLESYNIPLQNRHIVLVGNGFLVGKPLSIMLKNRGLSLAICDKKTENLSQETQKADILISATGIAHLIKKSHLKKGAVVVDVGTAKLNNKIVGDVDFDNAIRAASLITPAIGGVGPLTIAMLIENIITSYKLQKKLEPL